MAVMPIIASQRARSLGQEAGAPLAWLAVGLGAMLLLFHREAAAAVQVWIESTAYNHCFLVIPISLYLIWDRRAELAGFVPRPAPLLALLAVPLALAWFVADRIGFMEGRQLVALTGAEVLFLAVLGPRAFWQLCGPLLYLYFLVPFGDFLTPALQSFTASFVMHGLDLLGIANYTDGLTIQIPEGTFYIAEACAGLRFLVAAVAFGCLYALLIYRSPLRRALFIGVSLIVPVIANGFRALGIVALGHVLGSAEAAETDHVLYGWIFFSIVLLILIALGLPFREDIRRQNTQAEAGMDGRPVSPRLAALAAVAAVLLFSAGPALAAVFDRLVQTPTGSTFHFGAQFPCEQMPAAGEDPKGLPGGSNSRDYRCNGVGLVLRAELFSPRVAPRVVAVQQAGLADFPGLESHSARVVANGQPWRVVTTLDPPHIAASLIWANGRAVQPGLRFRLVQAWHSLAGGRSPVILLVATPQKGTAPADQGEWQNVEAALKTFLTTQAWIPAALSQVSSNGHE